ncbi:MAG: MotA/TolQ/ExbB proton channel family protein [Alphaproteobacteria bacterium]|nr:MotA/TolQ/ExbB proton channel family protein [Alphaproteobacteria bacterium]
MNSPAPLSVVALFVDADIVVKVVLLLLLAGSVWSWAIIIEKIVRLRAAAQSMRALSERTAEARTPQELAGNGLRAAGGEPAGAVLAAGVEECIAPTDGVPESLAERRDRIDRAMRLVLGTQLRRLEHRLPFLATLGSAAPFVGLFGTVWGIMRSFNAIAAANNTSLAVVAPGIADALFATAMGLAAAIPAVVAYNKFTVDIGRFAGAMQGLIGRSSGILSRSAVEGE